MHYLRNMKNKSELLLTALSPLALNVRNVILSVRKKGSLLSRYKNERKPRPSNFDANFLPERDSREAWILKP